MKTAQRTKQPGQYNRSFNQFISSQPACEYTLTTAHDDYFQPDDFDNPTPYKVSYGFATVKFWIPTFTRDGVTTEGHWESPDPTKFMVHGEDFQTTKSEFWARFHMYCEKRFGRRIYTYSSYRAEQRYASNSGSRFDRKSSTTDYAS
jgi:hypothetical protein